MALWTYKIDALHLNDHTNFAVTEAPQIDDLPPGEIILVEYAGDWPEFVRWQPNSGLLTVGIFAVGVTGGRMRSVTEAEWAARIATLQGVLTAGLHTFTARARGWAADKYVMVVPRSMGTNFKLRQISLELVVPKPVWVPV